MMSGIRSAVPPSNGAPSRVPTKPIDGVVAFARAPLLDRDEGGLLVAQLVDDALDLRVVDRRRSPA